MRSIPRLKEEFLKDRLRLEIRIKILRKIRNYYSADSLDSCSKKILNQNPNQNALEYLA